MKKLTGKVAVVTGGARGIGRKYALRLAELGADVGVIDINLKSYQDFEGEEIDSKYETVVDELQNIGVKSIGYEADITSEEQVIKAFEAIKKELGPIEILIANAGGGSGSVDENMGSEIDTNELDIVMKRNLHGTIYSVKAVIDDMKRNKYGKIVTVTSVAGLKSINGGGYSHYGAAKAAIVSYTKSLAQDVGKYNINANAIAPGYIGTGRLMEQFKKAGVEKYESETALKRLGTPMDCANVIEFLASDLSDYVTGTVIDVTGGLLK